MQPNAGPIGVASQVRNVAGLVTSRWAYPDQASFSSLSSDWSYDVLTRVTSQTVTHHQPFGSPTQLARQDLDYFGQDDPSRLQHWMGGSYYDLAFDYDDRHQLTAVNEDQQRFTASYSFTTAGKLASADVAGASTPAPGEDVVAREATYVYPPQPWSMTDPEAVTALRVSGDNLREYAYDTVGNMVERVAPADGVTEAFVYDGEDQLRRASSSAPSSDLEEYFYDHAGQRIAVVTRESSGVVKGLRLFLGDTELEVDAGGHLGRSYAHLSLGTPVARIIDRGQVELQYHGLSSNTLLTVAADGTIKTGFVYGPYGELIEAQGPGKVLAAQHRRFNDKYKDDLTKLSYYGVRYYDGVLLGWTQADPLYRFSPDSAWGQPRRASLYSFTGLNPLRYIDPDGRDVVEDVAGAWMTVNRFTPQGATVRFVGRIADGKSAPTVIRETAADSAEMAAVMTPGGGLRAALLSGAGFGSAALLRGESPEKAAKAAATAAVLNLTAERVFAAAATEARAVLGAGRAGCFVAGTLVLTEHGPKPIEEVQQGELVWAFNVETGNLALSPVLQTFVRERIRTLDVVVRLADGTEETLRTTEEHPFWTERGWSPAGALKQSDWLQSHNSVGVRVEEVALSNELETVFNLEVDGAHTYFVGSTGVLVHNNPCAAAELPQMKGSTVQSAEETLAKSGFTQTHVSSSAARNQTWQHPDGSEVRIHPYGNQATSVYKSANNAHIHKEDPTGQALTDKGLPSSDPSATHIGIKNPPNLPAVRGRPHGAGTQ